MESKVYSVNTPWCFETYGVTPPANLKAVSLDLPLIKARFGNLHFVAQTSVDTCSSRSKQLSLLQPPPPKLKTFPFPRMRGTAW